MYLNDNEVLRIQKDSTKGSYIYNFAGDASLETRSNKLTLNNSGYKVMSWYDGMDEVSGEDCPF
jgi:hypothetical protein